MTIKPEDASIELPTNDEEIWEAPTAVMKFRQVSTCDIGINDAVARASTFELSPEQIADLQALSRIGRAP